MNILKDVTCINEAVNLLNEYLNSGNILGGDFIGVTSGRISKIWNENNIFKFFAEDCTKEEYQFKFKNMKVLEISKEKNGKIFIFEAENMLVEEAEKDLVSYNQDCIVINEFFVNNKKCNSKEEIEKLHSLIDCGDESWDNVFERYKIMSGGIVGILNIQPQPMNIGVLLYELRNKQIKL